MDYKALVKDGRGLAGDNIRNPLLHSALHDLCDAVEALEKDRERWMKEREEMQERLIRYSWAGQVDRMSGAFDPNDRHEMGG